MSRSVTTTGSTAAEMVAEQSKAEVQGAMILAKKFPRNEEESRISIINSCKNLRFAEKAIYKKPVGKTKQGNQWIQNYVEGPSIRFAEEMLRHWRNIKVQEFIIYEDVQRRIVRVVCYDLESNSAYSEDIIIEKTVERKNPFGREVIGERLNSYNEKISIVLATEDEVRNKEKAAVSKAIRNNGLRLIPAHIVEEAVDMAQQIIKEGVNRDPMAGRRKVLDSFSKIGIMPKEIEEYLKKPIEQITADDVLDLKQIYNSIKDGESKWSDYLITDAETTDEKKPEKTAWEEEDEQQQGAGFKPGDPATHQDVKGGAKKKK